MRFVYIFLLFFSIVYAEDIYMGETWEFAEKNLLEEIETHIDINEEKILAKLENFRSGLKDKVENFKPKGVKSLPRAEENRVFYPDMTYTNPEDIVDHRGVVLYPKGYKFNPLKYIQYPLTIVVIDGSDREQIEWLQNNNFIDNLKYKILITDGKFGEISKELGQPVFFALKEVQERFQLEHVPSIIKQKGESLEVQEVCLDCNSSTTFK